MKRLILVFLIVLSLMMLAGCSTKLVPSVSFEDTPASSEDALNTDNGTDGDTVESPGVADPETTPDDDAVLDNEPGGNDSSDEAQQENTPDEDLPEDTSDEAPVEDAADDTQQDSSPEETGEDDETTENTAEPSQEPEPTPTPQPEATPKPSAGSNVIAFEDETLAAYTKAYLNKNGDLTQADLDSFGSFTIIGPFFNEGLGNIVGFGANYYLGANNEYYTEEGLVQNLADVSKFRNLTSVEVTWQQNLDPSTLTLPSGCRDLRLRHDKLTDISFLSNFPKLTHLILDQNMISNIEALSGMTKMIQLSLRNNQITDVSPLAGMNDMIWLDISNNPITDLSPLDNLKKLKDLYASNVNGLTIETIAGLTELKHLNISGCSLSDLSGIEALTKLEHLALGNNQISDISILASLKNLSYIDLSNNPVSDLSVLAELPNLQRVHVWGTADMSDPIILQLQSRGIAINQ